MVKMRLCTLRQTVILIGLVDTILSLIVLLLLLLGSSHAQNMSQMIDEDVWNVAHDDTLPRAASNNGVRMHQAQKLAYVTLDSIRLLIFLMTFHLISSICLLCGSVQRQREVLLLWLCSMACIIILAMAMLVLILYSGYDNIYVICFAIFATKIYCCLWVVVLKFHRQMVKESCIVDNVDITPNLKSSLIQSEKDSGLTIKPQYV